MNCADCKVELTKENWFKSCQKHRTYVCKKCSGKRGLKSYYKHRTKRLETVREYKKLHPNEIKNSRLKCLFGITLEKYNQMFEEQRGCCLICGKHQTELSITLGVDHNHKTGEVRGLLCHFCNIRLGVIEDKNFISKANDYLNKEGGEEVDTISDTRIRKV